MNQYYKFQIWLWIIPTLLLWVVLIWAVLNWRTQKDNPVSKPVAEEQSGTHAVPTFTPTRAGQIAAQADLTHVAPQAETDTRNNNNAGAVNASSPQPGDTTTPTATPAPDPQAQLSEAVRLHRYGYYTDEQWVLLAVLADPGSSQADRVQARYQLAESYLAEDNFAQALSTLAQFEQETAGLPTDDDRRLNAIFLRAEALAGLGRAGEAIEAYRTFLDARPELAEIIYELIAQLYRDADNPIEAAAAYRRAADTTPGRSTQARLLEAQASMLETAGRWAEAATVYEEILSFAENPGYRMQIGYLAGAAHDEAGNDAAAVERWQGVLAEQPGNKAAYQALVALVDRNVAVDAYLRGTIDLQAEAYVPAVTAFEAFLAEKPDDPRVGQALLGLGQAHLALGNFDQALTYLDRVIADHPTCACFGQAWLDKARMEILRGNDTAGRRIYRTFAREHPENPLAPEALWRSALSAISADNEAETAADIQALADSFPGSERTPNALYTLGIGAMVNQLFDQAVASFSRLQANYPNSRWQATTYWLGRAHFARGEVDQARAQWQSLVEREPDTYYGVLAGLAIERSGDPGRNIFTGVDQLPNPASTLPGDDGSQAFAEEWLAEWINVPVDQLGTLPPEVAADPDLVGGQQLLELDRRGEALQLLDRVYQRYRDNPATVYALALRFEELRTYGLSVTAASRLLSLSGARLVENTPIFLQQMVYPRHFSELIEAEARSNNIDPLLLYSLIRQESIFEEGARSYAAAQGLAQIIPSTGAEIAQRLGYPNYTNALIYRPHINVRFGAFYLAWVRDYVDGNQVAALAGYNAGPGNARSWQERAGPDDALFVELMTFAEPRLYVERILSNYYHYNRLYGS